MNVLYKEIKGKDKPNMNNPWTNQIKSHKQSLYKEQVGALERNGFVSVHKLGGNPKKLCLCSIYCLEKQIIACVLPEVMYVCDWERATLRCAACKRETNRTG